MKQAYPGGFSSLTRVGWKTHRAPVSGLEGVTVLLDDLHVPHYWF
jgi:hypothetical protein